MSSVDNLFSKIQILVSYLLECVLSKETRALWKMFCTFVFGLSKAKVEPAEEVGRITVIKVWVEMAATDKNTIEGPFSSRQS